MLDTGLRVEHIKTYYNSVNNVTNNQKVEGGGWVGQGRLMGENADNCN